VFAKRSKVLSPRRANRNAGHAELVDVLAFPGCPWEPAATPGWQRLQVDRALALAFRHGHSLTDLEARFELVIRCLGGYRDDDSDSLPYFVVPDSALEGLAVELPVRR
jgi:hypothetical protein